MGLVKDSEPSTTKRNEAKWYDMIWPGITRIGSSGGSPAQAGTAVVRHQPSTGHR